MAALPNGLRELAVLEILLPQCGMGASGALELGRFISRCTMLRMVSVNVRGSMLFSEGASAICRSIPSSVRVLKLDLSANELGTSGCRQVSAASSCVLELGACVGLCGGSSGHPAVVVLVA
mmetsp:Transcript_34019/g.88828  ORF Transcript_34019/g.88828 Transcript_34019/m.88828 type:complete len:121 (+) Transcript_34019:2122-2484(+)